MTRIRLLSFAPAAFAGALAVAVGGLVADPLGAIRGAGEFSLRRSGARVELFRGPSGERLRVWVAGPPGESVPVVLLHGLGAAGDYWARAARSLVRSGRTVIIPDAPGSGESEPPRDGEWGLGRRVEAVRTLAGALGLRRFDLVGHSLGGWTAARFAIDEPHQVHRLVLVDPGGFSSPLGDDERAFRRNLVPTDRAGGIRLLDLLFFRKPFPVAGFVADAVARNYSSSTVASTVAGFRASDALLGRESELPVGTVLIWGERETLFPVVDAFALLSRLRQGRLLVITGVGHDGPLEAPEAFEEALAAALEGRALRNER